MKQTPLVVKSYLDIVRRGGPGSGHFGHEGRPGEVGGSQPSDFHSSPGKKGWGRPPAHDDGTTVVDGKRAFTRGWDAEAIERKKAIREELTTPKKEDEWLSDITPRGMMAADVIMDYWADIDRFESASGTEKPVPIELILAEVVNTFDKLAQSGGKNADLYARSAERAKHLLAANDGDTDYVKENRTRVVLAELWLALRLEVPRTETSFLGTSVNAQGVLDYSSDFFMATKEKVLVGRIIAGAAQAERDARSVTFAEDERELDRALTESDWQRWDWVRENMRGAEEFRQALVSTPNPISNSAAAERRAQFDRMIQLIRERETELAKPDPNGKVVQEIEQLLNTEQQIAVKTEKEQYRGVVPQGTITQLAGAFGVEPAPETIGVAVADREPDDGYSASYRVVSEGIRPEIETNLTTAKAILSMVASPELISKAPDTSVVQMTSAEEVMRSAHFNPGSVMQRTPSLIAIPATDFTYNTLAHEITHAIEHGSKELKTLGWMFYRYRGGGEKPTVTRFGNIYRYDRFADPYSGYSYDDAHRYQSEVLSTGVQQLASNPAMFAALDPEFFNFVVTALRGGWTKETQ